MTLKQQKRIDELQRELAQKKKASQSQNRKGGGGAKKRQRDNHDQFALTQLDPFSRDAGAKWPDSNASRSITDRSRTMVAPSNNATYTTSKCFAVRPSLAAVVWSNPTMTSAEDVSDWNNGTSTPTSGYSSLAASAYRYRVVAMAVDIMVTDPAITAKGVITLITNSSPDTGGLPGSRSTPAASKQVYPYKAGQTIRWISKPLDNTASEYIAPTAVAYGWQSLAVFCTGLSADAAVQLEVRLDLECLPVPGEIIANTATAAAPYSISKLEAIANQASSLSNSYVVQGLYSLASLGIGHQLRRQLARTAPDNGAAAAA